MIEPTKRHLWTSIIIATIALVCLTGPSALAGNKQLMSQKIAKQDMKRNLVEMIIGYKVKSIGEFGQTQDNRYQVEEKAAAILKGAQVDKLIYDRTKDIAFCLGHVNIGKVETVTGSMKNYDDITVQAFGFGSMTPTSKPALMALRAAQLEAYDALSATLVGEKISAYSQSENFILTEDTNKSKVCAAVYGAYVPNPDIDAENRGWGWNEDGDAWIKLRIEITEIEDLLGNLLKYDESKIIEVIGHGAQADELAQEKAAQKMTSSGSTQFKSLDIPTQQDVKGKAVEDSIEAKESKPQSLEGGAVSH